MLFLYEVSCNLMKLFYLFTKVAVVPEAILIVKREVDSEVLGEEQTWSRAEATVSVICAIGFLE